MKETINMDVDLENLTKVFIEEAMKGGYTISQIDKAIKDQKMMILINNLKNELLFRQKAFKFVNYYYRYYSETFSYIEDGVKKTSNPILETIYAAYKVFNNPEIKRPQREDLTKIVKERLRNCTDYSDIEISVEASHAYATLKELVRKENIYDYFGMKEFLGMYFYDPIRYFEKNRNKTSAEVILKTVWRVNITE